MDGFDFFLGIGNKSLLYGRAFLSFFSFLFAYVILKIKEI